jgi:hypothetical protein
VPHGTKIADFIALTFPFMIYSIKIPSIGCCPDEEAGLPTFWADYLGYTPSPPIHMYYAIPVRYDYIKIPLSG